jgi:hypothetical protein
LLVYGEHKVQRRVVAVNELDILAPVCDSPLEEVADVVCTLGYMLIYLANNLLLLAVGLQRNGQRSKAAETHNQTNDAARAKANAAHCLVVELSDPCHPMVVDDQDGFDHGICCRVSSRASGGGAAKERTTIKFEAISIGHR